MDISTFTHILHARDNICIRYFQVFSKKYLCIQFLLAYLNHTTGSSILSLLDINTIQKIVLPKQVKNAIICRVLAYEE